MRQLCESMSRAGSVNGERWDLDRKLVRLSTGQVLTVPVKYTEPNNPQRRLYDFCLAFSLVSIPRGARG